MAPDLKSRKRKAAPAPAVANTKKPRKSDSDVIAKPAKVEKKRRSLPVAPVDDSSDEGVTIPTPKKAKKTTTKVKAANGATKTAVEETKVALLDEDDPKPKTKKPGKSETEDALIAFESEDSADEVAGDEAADQTAALLKGFESSSESDDDEVGGVAIEDIPKPPKAKKGKKGAADEEYTPGVIYVGRIPHGFYEHQMNAYFSQFGEILHLRLSRNKKTGASRHYAFIEFASMAVAKIVAATMNKYLLFGHILQVRVVPPEQVHPDLFKGAGRRFKVIPRNKLEREKLAKGASRETWKKRIENENQKRAKKAEKLKELGYEFDAPELMDVDAVPVRGPTEDPLGDATETRQPDGEAAKPQAIEAAKPEETIEDIVRTSKASPGGLEVTEKVTVKKGKDPKAKKTKKTKTTLA